jgi:hypothetical protein
MCNDVTYLEFAHVCRISIRQDVHRTSCQAAHQWPQASLLLAIDHEARPLRHVVGTNVATIVAVDGLGGWPQLLPTLVRCLESDSVGAAEGALDALSKVSASRHRSVPTTCIECTPSPCLQPASATLSEHCYSVPKIVHPCTINTAPTGAGGCAALGRQPAAAGGGRRPAPAVPLRVAARGRAPARGRRHEPGAAFQSC